MKIHQNIVVNQIGPAVNCNSDVQDVEICVDIDLGNVSGDGDGKTDMQDVLAIAATILQQGERIEV